MADRKRNTNEKAVEMVSSTSLPPISNGAQLLFYRHPNPPLSSPSFMRGLRKDGDTGLVAAGNRIKGHALRVLANPNVSSKRGNSSNEVVMVDPLEAKQLAAKQMQQIQAKEKLKRKRQIEAVNGAWAMIGLTAGLVIESQTGNSIPEQLASYWGAIVSFFVQ